VPWPARAFDLLDDAVAVQVLRAVLVELVVVVVVDRHVARARVAAGPRMKKSRPSGLMTGTM